jgi:alcohol dehydrogenase class IV
MLDPALSLSDLAREKDAVVWASPSVAQRVAASLPHPLVTEGDVPPRTPTVVAVGGGALIDRAKAAIKRDGRAARLVAVPSRWGAGAEVSPVLVLDGQQGKEVSVSPAYVPDARGFWPELAATLDERAALDGCADAWAHALEALVSPLASADTRNDAAELVEELAALPVGRDPRWFEASARACAIQARAGVGLAHGIAHALEGRTEFGHAALIAAWLPPCSELLSARREVPVAAAEALLALWNAEVHAATADALREHWPAVLRDPCTRTNGVRVRRDDLQILAGWAP